MIVYEFFFLLSIYVVLVVELGMEEKVVEMY